MMTFTEHTAAAVETILAASATGAASPAPVAAWPAGTRTCATCRHPIRHDTEHYDSPRWVHVHIVDAAACTIPHTWCSPPAPVLPVTTTAADYRP